MKLQNSFLLTYWLKIVLIFIQLTIEYGVLCRIICIRCQFEWQDVATGQLAIGHRLSVCVNEKGSHFENIR